MDFTHNKLIRYCEQHSTPPSEALQELERETNLKTLAPQMLSGTLQGQLLRFISIIKQPKRILEIGTFTGYSALCLADGLASDGVLHTIEGNEELAFIIHKYIQKTNLENKVILHIGDAKKIIPTFDEMFDLVFIDAAKNDYALFFDLIIDKLNQGGLLIADNVLWSNKVVLKEKNKDKDTSVIDAFNKKILKDDRLENIILPIRDGLVVARKL